LGDTRVYEEDNMKTDVRELDFEDVKYTEHIQDTVQYRASVVVVKHRDP
jgi:hypothetical protein